MRVGGKVGVGVEGDGEREEMEEMEETGAELFTVAKCRCSFCRSVRPQNIFFFLKRGNWVKNGGFCKF